MILPFGLGCAIAWGLYNEFRNDGEMVEISFGVYALFIGTALAITAFPVLCRILTELKLLRSSVGVTVLAAGIGNDVTGWILLALCVALVNNSSGLAALWALLCAVGWTLFLVFAVRPAFRRILQRTGSLQQGPTQAMVALTMLMTLISAWFTGLSLPFVGSRDAVTGSMADNPWNLHRHHWDSPHLRRFPRRTDLPARFRICNQTDGED